MPRRNIEIYHGDKTGLISLNYGVKNASTPFVTGVVLLIMQCERCFSFIKRRKKIVLS